jgi:hypothetical protein
MKVSICVQSRIRKTELAGGLAALLLNAFPGGGLAQDEVVLIKGRQGYQD